MKIGINCGHSLSGQPGCGAVGIIDESVETRNVGKELMKLFKNAGHTVVDCTNDYAKSTSENLSKIVSLANAQSLDLFVSIHFNSFNGTAKGTEAYTYGGTQHKEAVNVCKNLAGLGFTNRGVKDGSSLYVVRKTKAKAILIEVCFVDNGSDVDRYKSVGVNGIAKAIYAGITGTAYTGGGNVTTDKKQLTDIKGHWAEKHIQKLFDYGIVNGDENHKYNPDKPITRAEAAVIASNVLTICGK